METEAFDVEQTKTYWLTEAQEAIRVAGHLVEKGDYSYALFFGHLAIEKVLKALYVARLREHAPPIHNLLRLAKVIGLKLSESLTESLITVTAFNIETRYPDVKRAFRQKCTWEYTTQQMALIQELHKWLISQMP